MIQSSKIASNPDHLAVQIPKRNPSVRRDSAKTTERMQHGIDSNPPKARNLRLNKNMTEQSSWGGMDRCCCGDTRSKSNRLKDRPQRSSDTIAISGAVSSSDTDPIACHCKAPDRLRGRCEQLFTDWVPYVAPAARKIVINGLQLSYKVLGSSSRCDCRRVIPYWGVDAGTSNCRSDLSDRLFHLTFISARDSDPLDGRGVWNHKLPIHVTPGIFVFILDGAVIRHVLLIPH
jgi:hypothetical protein